MHQNAGFCIKIHKNSGGLDPRGGKGEILFAPTPVPTGQMLVPSASSRLATALGRGLAAPPQERRPCGRLSDVIVNESKTYVSLRSEILFFYNRAVNAIAVVDVNLCLSI